jgi:hypothetical protein
VRLRPGVTGDVSSRNPIVLNFGPWIGLAKDLASARSAARKPGYTCSALPAGGRTVKGLTARPNCARRTQLQTQVKL